MNISVSKDVCETFGTHAKNCHRMLILMFTLTREDVDEMFATHDKDRDGMLSWEEFSGEETKNEKAFKLMDADHNGKITKSVS